MKKALKIPVYIIAVFFLTVAAVIYVYLFTTLPESELNHLVAFRALRDSGYDVRFGRINRDVWDHVVLEEVTIAPENPGEGISVAINRIEIEYNIFNLAGGKYILDIVDVDSISLKLPERRGAKEDQEIGAISFPFSMSAENSSVGSIVIDLPGGNTVYVDSLRFGISISNDKLRADCRNLALRWPERDFEIRRLAGSLVTTPDGFRVEKTDLITGKSNLLIEGNTGATLVDKLDINVKCGPIDLNDVRNLTGVRIKGVLNAALNLRGSPQKLEGDAEIDGIFMDRTFDDMEIAFSYQDKKLSFDKIDGEVFHSRFRGSGDIDFGTRPEEYHYEGLVTRLDLREIGPELATDFSGRLRLTGRSFAADQFGMRINCDLDSVRVENYFFNEVSGTVNFNLKKIDFLDGFRARYKNTHIEAAGELEYSGNINLGGTVRFEDLTDFTDQVFLKKLGGGGAASFELSGPTGDFNVEAYFDSDSCWTYGLEPDSLHIGIDLNSFTSHRVGMVSGRWIGGELYSVPTDSGFIEASVSGERAFLDMVRVFGLEGGLQLSGLYDGTQIPPSFKADTLYGEIFGNRFSSKEPITINIYERETEIESLRLGYRSGVLEIRGIITNDLDMNLGLSVSDFQIQPLIGQVYPEKEVRGIWSGTARILGNFVDPEIELDYRLDNFSVDNIGLGTLTSTALYADGYLHTDSTQLWSQYGSYRFSGRLPIDLSFAEVDSRFPEKPIDLSLITEGERFLLAEIFVDAVESFETRFKFELRLTGTYSDPLLQGTGELSEGNLKSQYMVNHITGINAAVRMENEKIFIDSVTASVVQIEKEWDRFLDRLFSRRVNRPKPVITASGTITLLGLNNFLYDLDVRGRNVDFKADAYDVSGIAGFELRVEGETPPVVRGNIALSRLDIRDEFENFVGRDYDPAIAAVEDSSMWNLDLNVTALNNIWIKNRDVDGEFKADIRVQRRVGIMGALGTLEAIRGSYNVLGEKPDFRSGTITYPDFAAVDPEIDFVVVKRIRPLQGDGSETAAEPFDMEIHITGTLLFPVITVAGFSEDEALRMLVSSSWAGRTLGSERNSQDYLNSVNALAASLGLDPSTAQGIFEELEISEFEADKGPRFSLAKYISPNLYVRFSRRLRDPESTLGVEYYLNDNFSFKATQGMKGSQSEGISFDLNFNYEY